MAKRTFNEAFKRRNLNKVDVGGFYVHIDLFKVLSKNTPDVNNIVNMENNEFEYDDNVIKKGAKSATEFDREQSLTKTELIELFAKLSINDVWSAEYKSLDKSNEWQNELASKIQSLPIDEASVYIKKNFGSFGKTNRSIVGNKINHTSDNNYYLIHDLEIYFDLLKEGKSVQEADKQSIRNLDVNSLQYLIFNGVKYILKT